MHFIFKAKPPRHEANFCFSVLPVQQEMAFINQKFGSELYIHIPLHK